MKEYALYLVSVTTLLMILGAGHMYSNPSFYRKGPFVESFPSYFTDNYLKSIAIKLAVVSTLVLSYHIWRFFSEQ